MAYEEHQPDRLPTFVALEAQLRERARAEEAEAAAGGRALASARRLAALAVGAMVALALVITPAGAKLVDVIEDLIGVGDEPSRESQSPGDEPAVVIATATTPNGQAFEIVASSAPPLGADPTRATCISLDFAAGADINSAYCLTAENSTQLARERIAATAFIGREALAGYLVVAGFVDPAATRVVIEHPASGAVQATVAPLTPQLADAIGSRERTTFFLALVAAEGADADLPARVRALGPGGKVVATAELTAVAQPPSPGAR